MELDDATRLWVLEVSEQVSSMLPAVRTTLAAGGHDEAVMRATSTFSVVAETAEHGGERVATIAAVALVLLAEEQQTHAMTASSFEAFAEDWSERRKALEDERDGLRHALDLAEREFAAYRAEVGDQCAVAVELAAERDAAEQEVTRYRRALAELRHRIEWLTTDHEPAVLVLPGPQQDPALGSGT